jgi:hypothetical protein
VTIYTLAGAVIILAWMFLGFAMLMGPRATASLTEQERTLASVIGGICMILAALSLVVTAGTLVHA